MESMSKIERFQAAIRGEAVDHLPVSVWLHFASEHLSGEEAAGLHARFLEAYDWDYLKVMHDFRYPLPGIENIQTSEDLERFRPLSLEAANFSQQMALYTELRRLIGHQTPLVETLFDPLQTLVRAAGQNVRRLITEHPQAGHTALQTVTQSIINFIAALKETGVSGIFYSINGAVKPALPELSEAQFAQFVEPYNRQILEAADGMLRIAHLHGTDVDFERFLDYPVEAYSWSHFSGQPSLTQARRMTDRVLMGGIDETRIAYQSVADLTMDMRRSVEQAGPRKLLLGPGCTVSPDAPRRLLLAASRQARALR